MMCHDRNLPNNGNLQVTWGFIGLGQMGYPMAKNLCMKIPEPEKMVIFDINSDVMGRFVDETKLAAQGRCKQGGRQIQRVQSVREVAEKSNVIITCLPTVQIVKDTYLSIAEKGALPTLKQDRLFIDCSTIDHLSSRHIAALVHGTLMSDFVDAPMSGGAVGAQAGTLCFMFGSSAQSAEFIERVKSILLLMGTKALHMGNQGCGLSAKLANNYIVAINNVATAEALNMGRGWGLDLRNLTELINSSTGHCWPMEVNNPVPGLVESAAASRNYEPGCPISMINKDLGLAMTAALDSGIPLLLARAAREAYDAVDEQYPGRDFSIVYQYLQKYSSK